MAGAPISEPGCEAVPEAYGSAVSEATARFRSAAASLRDPASRRPDVVISFQPLFDKPEVAPLQYSMQYEAWPLRTNAYSLLVTLGETKAQGSLKLSGRPDPSPIVTHEPLTHPEDLERAAGAASRAAPATCSARCSSSAPRSSTTCARTATRSSSTSRPTASCAAARGWWL